MLVFGQKDKNFASINLIQLNTYWRHANIFAALKRPDVLPTLTLRMEPNKSSGAVKRCRVTTASPDLLKQAEKRSKGPNRLNKLQQAEQTVMLTG